MFGYNTLGFGISTPTPPGVTSIINNIQKVAITLGSGVTSNTATITSVDTTKAFVTFNDFTTTNAGTGNADRIMPKIVLTNGTTVTATRTTGTDSVTVYATVIEFVSAAIVSMQTGIINLSTVQTSNTATISAVNTANTFCVYGGVTTTETSQFEKVFTRVKLTNSTTVTARRDTENGETNNVAYTVVEFASGIIKSIQNTSSTFTSSATTTNTTISAVTLANTICFWGGFETAQGTNSNSANHYYSLTSTTNLAFTRTGTTPVTRTWDVAVVEFNPGYIKAKTAVQPSFTGSDTQIDTAITAFVEAKSFVNSCHFTPGTSGLNANAQSFATLITSTTNVRALRNTASNTATAAFELIEFY